MSYRVFSPQEYPLPYIIEDLNEWPITRLTEKREEFVRQVEESVYQKLKAKYPTEKGVEGRTFKNLVSRKNSTNPYTLEGRP